MNTEICALPLKMQCNYFFLHKSRHFLHALLEIRVSNSTFTMQLCLHILTPQHLSKHTVPVNIFSFSTTVIYHHHDMRHVSCLDIIDYDKDINTGLRYCCWSILLLFQLQSE